MSKPNIADELQSNWHKVAAMLLHRLGGNQTFSAAEIAALPANQTLVASHEQGGTVMRLRLLPNAEAERLAREFESERAQAKKRGRRI